MTPARRSISRSGLLQRSLATACAAGLLAGSIAGCGRAVTTPGTSAAPSAGPSAVASFSPLWTETATQEPTSGPQITPVDVFATPTPPPSKGALPTDQVDSPASRRLVPAQSVDWLKLKAAGRIALIDGKVVVLPITADPLVNPSTGQRLPAARMLETGYARWIIEPLGSGKDAKGNTFTDKNYWDLCESGATTSALYYWQLQTGRPDVTGTAGWFLDPYEAEGVAWPSPGPTVVKSSDGKRIGTYWTGTDTVNGFTAHGRGYMMYVAMAMQPPGWLSKGEPVYADANGKPLYPTIGAPRTSIQVALNWEASGQDESAWVDYWYASVMRFEPTAARDLQMAVTLDVGRDGVPVVMELDTHGLPNWQAGAKTPHIRHAITIVGYDNAANPPTYTYIDTCGRACNGRSNNQNGGVYVIAQSQMVAAMQDTVGSGFLW